MGQRRDEDKMGAIQAIRAGVPIGLPTAACVHMVSR
jgi:hypothetical protein